MFRFNLNILKMRLKGFFVFMLLLNIIFNGCKDPCDNVNCNNGDCVEGECVCDDGWMGDDCNTMRSSLFKGYWEGVMNCMIVTDTAGLIIKSGDNPLNQIKIQTHNLQYTFGGLLTIDFDNYIMTGNLDPTYKKFDIVPLPVSISLPNDIVLNVIISGNGILNDRSEIELSLKIDFENPQLPDILCTGIMKN